MIVNQRVPRAVLCFFLSLSPSFAGGGSAPSSANWLDVILQLPLFNWRSFLPSAAPNSDPFLPDVPPPCAIDPIPPLDDEEARDFEAAAGTADVVDRTGLTPATRLALARFERRITSLGGAIEVTSAYRPPAYQAHLQVVWDKWMQLRSNSDPNCAVIRAQAEDEFDRHQLLATQRPVPVSDHTLGTGFDAAVLLRGNRAIDTIARSAGVRRPDISHDPVHFRLIAAIR